MSITIKHFDIRSLTPTLPGTVGLFEFNKNLPYVSQDLLADPRTRPGIMRWTKTGIKNDDLAEALATMNFDSISAMMAQDTYSKTTLHDQRPLNYTESENFQMDLGYVFTFAKYLAKHKTIPTEAQFVQFWLDENAECVKRETTPKFSAPRDLHGPLSIAGHMLAALKENREVFKGEVALSFTEDTVSERIIEGFTHRAKKFYAACLREFVSLFWLSAPNIRNSPITPSVWWHPVLDVVLKADGLACARMPFARPFAVGIYLKSPRSDENIQRKAGHLLFEDFTELAIPMGRERDRVFLPDEFSIRMVRKALEANTAVANSYATARGSVVAK